MKYMKFGYVLLLILVLNSNMWAIGSINSLNRFRSGPVLDPSAHQFRSCPVTGPSAANFCNINIANQLCVSGNAYIAGNLGVSGIISGQDGLGYGNTAIVDQVDGNDATGAVNGPRFKTISAALAQTQLGDTVLVFPGIYNEAITVPDGVTVTGLPGAMTEIIQLNVTVPTDVVTLGEGAVLSYIDLEITTSEDVQIRGIAHTSPGGAYQAATFILSCQIFVTNSNPNPGVADAIGIDYAGATTSTVTDIIIVANFQVSSTSSGAARGIRVGSNQTNVFTTILAEILGSNAIGIEVDSSTADVQVFGSTIYGETADISQSSGILGLSSTYLVSSTANNLGFVDLIFPVFLSWTDPDMFIGGGTYYLIPGSGSVVVTPFPFKALQQGVARDMNVQLGIAPGAGQSITCTLYINGGVTPISVTVSGTNTSGSLGNVSAHFGKSDLLTMQIVNSAGSQAGQLSVTVAVY